MPLLAVEAVPWTIVGNAWTNRWVAPTKPTMDVMSPGGRNQRKRTGSNMSDVSTAANTPVLAPRAAPYSPQNIDELEWQESWEPLYVNRHGKEDDDLKQFEDGTLWNVSRGKHPPTLASLEEGLSDAKVNFHIKYEQDEHKEYIDGSEWIVTRGILPPTTRQLERSLAEVHELHLQKHFVVTRGDEPPTAELLFKRLAEVNSKYEEKFGRDGCPKLPRLGERLRRQPCDTYAPERVNFTDGTKWQVTRGSVTINFLEQSLDQLKSIFNREYYEDESLKSCVLLSAMERSEGSKGPRRKAEEFEKSKNGCKWVVTRGRNPPSISCLLKSLKDLKDRFRAKFAMDVSFPTADEGPESRHTTRGIFGASQFSQATKWDKKHTWKLNKLRMNDVPTMDGQEVEIDCEFMDSFLPSRLASTNDKNAIERKMRPSNRDTSYQKDVAHRAILRQYANNKRMLQCGRSRARYHYDSECLKCT